MDKDCVQPIFQFPFTPYDIQTKFMSQLYSTIEEGKLGIFESPTGTGKSLSICCGALQWLKDSRIKLIKNVNEEINVLKHDIDSKSDADDWLQEEYEKIKKNQKLIGLQTQLEKIKKQDEYFKELQNRVAKCKLNTNKIEHYFKAGSKNLKKEKENIEEKDKLDDKEPREDDDLLVENVENENEDGSEDDEIIEEEKDDSVKIYISSRTHSQLSQFVGEIKRTAFSDNTRVVTLASRQHYCINSDVSKLKNVNLINERCLDMQKSKTKSTSTGDDGKVLKKTKTASCTACPYYNQSNINKLKEHILVDIMDMEDLVKCGKKLKACPYYASRMALSDAEVVLVSHAGLVSSGARSGISLKLKNNVVIFDEAHGLTAALENAHSAPVLAKQLSSVKTYLNFYINKFRAKLSSKNLLLLNQISFVIGRLIAMLNVAADAKVYTIEDFVIKAEIDHLNLRPLVEFCKLSRLAPKLHGFSMRYNQQELEEQNKKSTVKKSSFQEFLKNISKKKDEEKVAEKEVTSVETKTNQQPSEVSAGSGLYAVLELLERLCERSEDGRVIVNTHGLHYALLNPNQHFAPLVEDSRSVIVAGGTMEPVKEFQELLTNNSTDTHTTHRVNVVRCEHVVPAENVLGICLTTGPSSVNLHFSYENRSSKELLSEVGRILRNIVSIVPGGVVCFLPSYSYEQVLYEHLQTTGVIEAICKKKTIFREPKLASDVDQVLQKFATAVKMKSAEHNGALLLSVVGGKLSEGLNFSDDLGRCVIVVGMPYPNIKSAELQEKINYINRKTPGGGNIYYENLCMKAVNQCIGRAVRHANDYACVLLVDSRYSRPQTVSALPTFVQKSLQSNCTFGQSIGSIAKFFARHKNKQ
ncbi:ATP-dependent DNA helicase DDX11 isoform X1 [Aricia agestis]|uniref:ATP-dependent DNA helicase DDX11 isoform X1 n=1 Tax=Aricia agestis TaxID=91739 RepID=UPI001C204C40|nr:ATP-dependent DNA helicase DDX11 isoform X1 [Aricia agestis]XP_041970233.1 ATP-dependent DNA helicase DDX11 isoform X1 [Aricia agestis]